MEQLNDVRLEALGYSWPKVPQPTFGEPKDPRVRVCPSCLLSTDRPDVKIVQVPPVSTDRPFCQRCHIVIGGYGRVR